MTHLNETHRPTHPNNQSSLQCKLARINPPSKALPNLLLPERWLADIVQVELLRGKA